jgi:hypothetical protein
MSPVTRMYMDGHDATLCFNPRWSGDQSFSYNTVIHLLFLFVASLLFRLLLRSSLLPLSFDSFSVFTPPAYVSISCSAIPSLSSYNHFFTFRYLLVYFVSFLRFSLSRHLHSLILPTLFHFLLCFCCLVCSRLRPLALLFSFVFFFYFLFFS